MSYTVDFNRYIFFDSLFHDAPQLAANVRAHYSNIFSTVKDPTNTYQNNPLDYIKDFLSVVKQLAERERATELKYLNSKHKDFIKTYIDNNTNHFNYLDFITDLNLAKQGSVSFIETIARNINNLNTLQQITNGIREKPIQYLYKKKNETEAREKIGSYSNAQYLYKTGQENDYRALISAAARRQGIKAVPETINQQFAKEIQAEFKNLSHSPSVAVALYNIIGQQHPSLVQLQQALIAAAIENIDYKKINAAAAEDQDVTFWEKKIKQDLHASYKNILSNESTKLRNLEDFINAVAAPNSTGTGLSKFRNELQNQLYRLDDAKAHTPSGQLHALIDDFLKQLNEPNGKTEAKIKENFSKKAFKLIKEQQKLLESKNNQATNTEIRQQLQEIFIPTQINPNNINEILHKVFSLDSISGADTAELRAAVEAAMKKEGADIFLPGKKIQFKIDLNYTYHFNKVDIDDFTAPKAQKQKILELMNLVDHFGKRFLERYHKQSQHQNTNVNLAYQEYIKLMKQLSEQRKKLAQNLSQKDLQNLNKIFDSIFTGISVKEYQFYNNDIGYSEGSLGGNGLVVSAVPNLLRMIQLGGISVPDANIVIGALLNTFSSSVLGTSIFEDIKNFLATGAAMMLFDDGFTAGQVFLDNAKQNLEENFPETMHLLLLNNVYIPQSYVLQNIYENLVEVYGKIDNTFKNFSSGKRLTNANVKSEISLENNMNTYMLAEVYHEETTMQEKWEKISQEAQNSVTISFFFMAGMLDILQGLEKAFTNIA